MAASSKTPGTTFKNCSVGFPGRTCEIAIELAILHLVSVDLLRALASLVSFHHGICLNTPTRTNAASANASSTAHASIENPCGFAGDRTACSCSLISFLLVTILQNRQTLNSLVLLRLGKS